MSGLSGVLSLLEGNTPHIYKQGLMNPGLTLEDQYRMSCRQSLAVEASPVGFQTWIRKVTARPGIAYGLCCLWRPSNATAICFPHQQSLALRVFEMRVYGHASKLNQQGTAGFGPCSIYQGSVLSPIFGPPPFYSTELE